MNSFFTTLGLAAILFFIFNYFMMKRRGKRLVALEATFPTKAPTECPKCGNSEQNRKGMTKSAPIFHDPNHWDRSAITNTPEHLSHTCWNCGFKVMTAPQRSSSGAT